MAFEFLVFARRLIFSFFTLDIYAHIKHSSALLYSLQSPENMEK